MTRSRCARNALRWTTAGVLLLAGCGDGDQAARRTDRAAADDQPIARWIAPPPGAIASETLSTTQSEPSRRASDIEPARLADDRITPAWYPFEDPPLPTLSPADGSAAVRQRPAPSEPVHRAPALESAPANSEFERLPPVDETVAAPTGRTMFSPRDDGERTPAPPARYVVDSPYSLEREPRGSRRDGRDTVAPSAEETPADQPANVERRYNDQPSTGRSESEAPSDTLRDLEAEPHGAPVFPATRGALPYGAANKPPRTQAPRDAVARDPAPRVPQADPALSTLSPRDRGEIIRPKDAALAEAHPIGKFERLPPVDETVANAPSAPTASATAAQPTAPLTAPRHREMDLIGERAGECIRRAYDLANRGAIYSAESEFTKALRMIAQALDAQQGTGDSRHAQALAAGLVALEESDDFAAATAAGGNIDLAFVVARHRTPILKDAALAEVTPIVAMQRYYTFAQEQLALAAEHEPAASSALYGLGKIQTTIVANHTGQVADGPKAIALHQAALLVDRRNFLAANELGVLMARCGRYDAAEAALRHSLAVAPTPAVWNNLAALHDRLGQKEKAAEARTQAIACAKTPSAATNQPGAPQQPVVWMDTAAFAQSSRAESDLKTAAASPSAKTTEQPAAQTSKKGFGWPFK